MCTHTHARARARTHTHTHYIHICTYIYPHTKDIYKYMYITHVYTHSHTHTHTHTHSNHVTSYNRLPQYPLATPLPPNRYILYSYTSTCVNTNYRVLLCSTLSSVSAFTSHTTLSRLQSWQFSVKVVYRGCHDNQVSMMHSLIYADSVILCKVNTQCTGARTVWQFCGPACSYDRQTDRQTDRQKCQQSAVSPTPQPEN